MPLLIPELVAVDAIAAGVQWSLHQDVWSEPDRTLLDSIDRLGLLRPPIVRPRPEGCELICGARRLAALHTLGHRSPIACGLVKSDISPADLLLLVAKDQLQSGPLSPVEAARFIALCTAWCAEPDPHVLGRLTSTTSTAQRKRLLSLLQLEEPVRHSVHLGRISERTGVDLARMSKSERLFVHELFTNLSLNKNKQRRFLELMQIIVVAEKCTIERFMTEHFAHLCGSGVDNAPQQTNALLKRLYEVSHPGSHAAREKFFSRVAEKKLPGTCRVSPQPSFETDKVTLEVEFKDFNAFSTAWEQIKKSL